MSCAVHIVLRAVYQTMVWNDISQQLNVPSPDWHGWKETNTELDILWHLKFCSPTRSQGRQFGKYYYVISLQDENIHAYTEFNLAIWLRLVKLANFDFNYKPNIERFLNISMI